MNDIIITTFFLITVVVLIITAYKRAEKEQEKQKVLERQRELKREEERVKRKEKEDNNQAGASLSYIVSKVMIADGRVSDEEKEKVCLLMRKFIKNEKVYDEFEKELKIANTEYYSKNYFNEYWKSYVQNVYSYEEQYALAELLLTVATLNGGIKQKEWMMIVSLFNLTSLDWSYLNNKFDDFFAFKSKQKATKKFNKTKKTSTGSKQNQNDGQQANSQSQQQKQALGAEQKKRYCAILGVTESATQEELHKAYTSLAKRYHPDTVQDEMLKLVLTEKLKEINTAYQRMRE
ncbi:MAG: DnaJ domain-containing protein [Paludibacteraceae bacterium]|nr:DnaJ domain-containing protein [Paludibacteraceae bacterium]